MSCRVVSCRVVSWRDVTWRDVTWRDVTWRDVSCRVVSYIHLGTAVYFQRHKTVTYCQQGDPFTLLCVVVYSWHKETSFVASAVIVYTDNLQSSRQTLWGIVISAATFVTSGAPCRTLSEPVGCPATFTLFLFRYQGVSCCLFHYSFFLGSFFFSFRIMFTLAMFSAPVNTFICACAASFALQMSIARSDVSSESLSNLSFILESLM